MNRAIETVGKCGNCGGSVCRFAPNAADVELARMGYVSHDAGKSSVYCTSCGARPKQGGALEMSR